MYRILFFSFLCAAHHNVRAFHLIQLTTFILIYVTVNIQSVLLWLECRHVHNNFIVVFPSSTYCIVLVCDSHATLNAY